MAFLQKHNNISALAIMKIHIMVNNGKKHFSMMQDDIGSARVPYSQS